MRAVPKLILFSLFACQTTSQVFLPQSAIDKYYLACGSSGSVSFRLHYRTNYLLSGFIDWDIERGIYFTNTIGAPLLNIERGEETYINLPNKYVSVTIDEDGRILLGGRFSGIYLRETLCVLEGYLSRSWFKETAKEVYENEENVIHLTKRDSGRKLHISMGIDGFRAKVQNKFLWFFTSSEFTLGNFYG